MDAVNASLFPTTLLVVLCVYSRHTFNQCHINVMHANLHNARIDSARRHAVRNHPTNTPRQAEKSKKGGPRQDRMAGRRR